MKLFSVVFLLASIAFAKNKVLYTVVVPGTDPKKPAQYDLFVMNDFKSPGTRLIERGRFSFVSSSDVIAYVREGNAEHKLFIITNFLNYNKIEIASDVETVKLQNNSLFYTQFEKVGDKVIRNLFVITDFKTLIKYKVQSDISAFDVDLN
ncbi:MAG: hypothetical protein H7235_08765 [Bdellovibrionaceae bacterium]|nr:hypothetical protein [Pseudobdellovibrionaceae bacterium]